MSSTAISDNKTPCEALSDDEQCTQDCNNIDAKTCNDCSAWYKYLKSVLMRNFARLLVGEPPRPIPIRSSATTLIFMVDSGNAVKSLVIRSPMPAKLCNHFDLHGRWSWWMSTPWSYTHRCLQMWCWKSNDNCRMRNQNGATWLGEHCQTLGERRESQSTKTMTQRQSKDTRGNSNHECNEQERQPTRWQQPHRQKHHNAFNRKYGIATHEHEKSQKISQNGWLWIHLQWFFWNNHDKVAFGLE